VANEFFYDGNGNTLLCIFAYVFMKSCNKLA
jgi:hypothetical protein